MKGRSPKQLAALSLLFALAAAPLPVVGAEGDSLVALTEKYQRDRKRLIDENLGLTAPEAKRFWPIYAEYERELFNLTERRRALIAEFGENYDTMSDAMARKIMLDRIELEEERHRLRRRFLPRFEKVLPIKKVARYYQIESTIRAAVEAGIADELPLIQ
jgi:hypothetical protein